MYLLLMALQPKVESVRRDSAHDFNFVTGMSLCVQRLLIR